MFPPSHMWFWSELHAAGLTSACKEDPPHPHLESCWMHPQQAQLDPLIVLVVVFLPSSLCGSFGRLWVAVMSSASNMLWCWGSNLGSTEATRAEQEPCQVKLRGCYFVLVSMLTPLDSTEWMSRFEGKDHLLTCWSYSFSDLITQHVCKRLNPSLSKHIHYSNHQGCLTKLHTHQAFDARWRTQWVRIQERVLCLVFSPGQANPGHKEPLHCLFWQPSIVCLMLTTYY